MEAVGLMSEEDKYRAARDEILKMVAEQFPEKYDELRLKLDGHPWTDVAMQLGKGTSSVYKQPKKLTEALHDALDKLWYLDI